MTNASPLPGKGDMFLSWTHSVHASSRILHVTFRFRTGGAVWLDVVLRVLVILQIYKLGRADWVQWLLVCGVPLVKSRECLARLL